MANNPQRVMPFGDHLEELRRRIFFALAGVVVLFIVGLIFGSTLLEVIAAPLIAQLKAAGQATSLLATSPLEAFASYVKVASIGALIVALPWCLYQLWLFISPGLHPQERRFVYFLLPLSGLLTAVGIAVLYFILLPIVLYFLISFGSGLITEPAPSASLPPGITLPEFPVLAADPAGAAQGQVWINDTTRQLRVQLAPDHIMGVPLVGSGLIAQQYRVSEYVNLVFMLGVCFAVAFQVPVVLMLLSWVGILRPEDLTPRRKYVVLGCAVGSALMPTQDPWSMLIMTGTLYGLFELGITLMRFVPARVVAAGVPGLRSAGTEPRRTDGSEEA